MKKQERYAEYFKKFKYWAKRVIGVILVITLTYVTGSFFPNQYILKDYDKKYVAAYLEKLKELDLREPEFAYANDLQFVKAMHKCIDYLNFTQPVVMRIPYEMITSTAALESWGTSRFAVDVIICLVY